MPHPSRQQSTQTPFGSWSQNPTGLWLPPQHQRPAFQKKRGDRRKRPSWTERALFGKTTWEWMSLLLIPLLVGIGTVLVTYQQTVAQNTLSEQLHTSDRQQHDTDLNIAQQARWDDLLKDYRDDIDNLLLSNHLLTSKPEEVVRAIAHSRTLDVLNAVDDTRRDDVIRYLSTSFRRASLILRERHISNPLSFRSPTPISPRPISPSPSSTLPVLNRPILTLPILNMPISQMPTSPPPISNSLISPKPILNSRE